MLGILLMAVFYNRKNFLWSKYFSDRSSHDNGEKGGGHSWGKISFSGKLLRRKLSQIGEKYEVKFHTLLTLAMPKDATSPNFTEKTFANSHKTSKFAKVFSLEKFPAWGGGAQTCIKLGYHDHLPFSLFHSYLSPSFIHRCTGLQL